MRRKRGRDATNGRFVTLDEARQRPRETIVETVRPPCPGKQDAPQAQGNQQKQEETA